MNPPFTPRLHSSDPRVVWKGQGASRPRIQGDDASEALGPGLALVSKRSSKVRTASSFLTFHLRVPKVQDGARDLFKGLGPSAGGVKAPENEWMDGWMDERLRGERGQRPQGGGSATPGTDLVTSTWRNPGTSPERGTRGCGGHGGGWGLPRATAKRPVAPRGSVTPDEEARGAGRGGEGRGAEERARGERGGRESDWVRRREAGAEGRG